MTSKGTSGIGAPCLAVDHPEASSAEAPPSNGSASWPAVVEAPARLAALDAAAILDTLPEEGFDDIVHLAASACETPVALVSLVSHHRQWFKAKVGFPRCETDLESSVCAHALVEPDLLVIADLAVDWRTRSNPLVVGAPHIRFYAGAPLRTSDGHVIGSLCVIDLERRPGGLTPSQAEDLRALGRQVMSQIELRRLLHERDALFLEQQASQALLKRQGEILQTITDNVGQAVFRLDDNGVVTFVNPAAERIFGWSKDELIGQGLHELIHHSHPDGRPFPATECRLRQSLVRNELLADVEEVFFHRDGTPIHALVTNAPVRTEGAASIVTTISDITRRKQAELHLAEIGAYWRGLFERLQEGLVVGRLARERGVVVDWRFIEVNKAFAQMTGIEPDAARGRSLTEVLPDFGDEWIDEPADAVDEQRPVTFVRPVGRLGRTFEGRISALGEDAFVMLMLDVTDRRAMERAVVTSARRRTALARLVDHINATMSVDAMRHTSVASIGQALEASQASLFAFEIGRASGSVVSSWAASGRVALTGANDLSMFGEGSDDWTKSRSVTVPDVAADPRARSNADALRAAGIAAFIGVAAPDVGVLLVGFPEPRPITSEEEEFIRTAVDRMRAGIARIETAERQDVLNAEISHRMKNTLAMVQAIANQTLKGASDRAAVNAFDQRLMALSTAHDVLFRKDWDAAGLAEVLQRVLDAAGAAGRYDAEGPPTMLGPRAALSTSLLLHELATNAAKYGALTRPDGRVEVRWRFEHSGEAEALVFEWRETGGPPASAPTRKGFGSRLLKMGLVGTGGSQLDYSPGGLNAVFRAPRTHVERT